MATRRQGVIYLEQQSPLQALLSGVSGGASQYLQEKQRRAEQAKTMEQQILLGVARGDDDPRAYASQEGRAFLSSAGLDKRWAISQMVENAEGTLPGKTVQTPSGAAVSMPQPHRPASEITEIIREEQEAQAVGKYDKQRRILLADQMVMAEYHEGIRQGRRLTPQEIMEKSKGIASMLGLKMDEVSWSVDESGQLRVSGRTPDVERSIRATERADRAEAEYMKLATDGLASRTRHVYRLGSILRGDFAADGDDDMSALLSPRAQAALKAAKSALGQGQGKDRVLQGLEGVEAMVKIINAEIESYNRQLDQKGRVVKKSDNEISMDQVPTITFEDVAGMSREDYLRRRKPPTGEEMLSQVREESRPAGRSDPRPTAISGKRDADRVTEVYNGLKDVVAAAYGKRPDLTAEEVKLALAESKSDLMAEYGLSERMYSMVVAMAERAIG